MFKVLAWTKSFTVNYINQTTPYINQNNTILYCIYKYDEVAI